MPPRESYAGMNCSVAAALEILAERWSFLVIREAFLGSRRFDQLQANLGIARNILTARLRKLVAEGVLAPRRYQARPERFEYLLTEKGRALYPIILALMAWGDRWAAPRGGPPAILVDRETRRPLEPALVDRRTGAPIELGGARLIAGPGANAVTRRRFEAAARGPGPRRP
jgi:DNA-binding HxlR family transcriptional regulator